MKMAEFLPFVNCTVLSKAAQKQCDFTYLWNDLVLLTLFGSWSIKWNEPVNSMKTKQNLETQRHQSADCVPLLP